MIERDRQAGKATPQERGYAVFSCDEFGPLEVKPEKGINWPPQGKPDLVVTLKIIQVQTTICRKVVLHVHCCTMRARNADEGHTTVLTKDELY